MTNTLKPIVFFGTEDFSLGTLQALLDADYSVAAVVTKPDSPQGRGHKLTSPPVKLLAEQYSIPVWQPQKLDEIRDLVTSLDAPLGVLVSYGKIVPQSIIDLFTPGIINVHPSLLPRYRGPSPIESAILNGDTVTGVSIMSLSAKMDAGPVYEQKTIPLTRTETAEELYSTLGKLGSEMLVATLAKIIDESIQPTPQQESEATYCQLIKKSDGAIDWNRPAVEIERKIRAYHQWPQCRAALGQIEVIVTQAHIETTLDITPGKYQLTEKGLSVQTASDAIAIDHLKPLGKKEMPIQAFLSGYSSQISN